MSTVVDFCDQKIVFIGRFINIDKLFESTISVSNELEELPLIYMQENEVHLIIIPYHAKIKIDEEVLGVWEILMKIRILESETGEKGKSAQSHICLLGNFPLEMVLRHEERAILLASHGVSYLRLPDKLDLDSIKEKIKDRSTPDNTRRYLTKLIDIRSLRHAYANIWGLDRLIQVHKKYYPEFTWEYPDDYKKQMNCVEYKMAKYIYEIDPVAATGKRFDTIQRLLDLRDELVRRPNIKILLIDDKAKDGWFHLIKSFILDKYDSNIQNTGSRVLHNRKVLNMEINEYGDDLFAKFVSKYNENDGVDVIISDLRLYSKEEHMYDYEQFKSIQLMKTISKHKVNPRAKETYKRTRYVLMTASNQLSNYKKAIKSKWAPSGIFIKEGFDYINTVDQQEERYREFLDVLINAIRDNYRKERYSLGGAVDTDSKYEEEKQNDFEKWITSEKWKAEILKQNIVLDRYDYVLLDTNVYYSEDEYNVAWNESEKIKCIYPVFVEFEWRSKLREQSFRNGMADLFSERFQDKIFKEYLTKSDLNTIDDVRNGAKKMSQNFADPYFLRVIKAMYDQDVNIRILFISDDKVPYNTVSQWVEDNKIATIHVLRPRDFYNKVRSVSSNAKKPASLKDGDGNMERRITYNISHDSRVCHMRIPRFGKIDISVDDWGGPFPQKTKFDKIVDRLLRTMPQAIDKWNIINRMKEIKKNIR